MPSKHTLKYLPSAQEDLLSILEFIAKDNPDRALLFINKLDNRISQLEQQPLLGRIPRHVKLREYGYRVLMVESYLVFYVVRGKIVEIHRVVYGSRNLDHLI